MKHKKKKLNVNQFYMKYFIDTEFHEFKKKPFISKPIDTIELISIGIIAENEREYYAISKDFDT